MAGVALIVLGWPWWRTWVRFGAVDAAAVCVAGVTLGDTWRHRSSLCVAGMALGDMDLHFAWQAWHLRHWAGYGGALGLERRGRRRCLRGRRGTWRHLATSSVALRGRRGTWRHGLCVAGVALMALGWLWWRAWVGFGSVDAAAVCVASVALGDIERRFAWQTWHLATWTSTLRGRRGTYGTGLALVPHLGWSAVDAAAVCAAGVALGDTWRHRASLCVAGVALGDMDFAWQAWHLWHWAGSGGALGLDLAPWTPPLFAWQAWHLATSSVALRGRRGTWRHGPPLCVAGVALTALGWLWCRTWVGAPWTPPLFARQAWRLATLGDIERRFAWQAWHLATWTLRGRRGTYGTGLALVAHLGWIWRRGRRRCLRGRRGAWRHLATSSVALRGRCLGDTDFAWQAWHLWHWAGSHTIFETPLHHFVTHHLCHTTLSHTPSFTHYLSHHFVTHHLSHTIFYTPSFTQLCHTPSFTRNFVTPSLSRLSHTTFTHTTFHTQLCHTPSFTHHL